MDIKKRVSVVYKYPEAVLINTCNLGSSWISI